MKLRICVISVILAFAVCSAAFAEEPDPQTAAEPAEAYEIGDPIPASRVAVMNLKVSGQYASQVKDWLPLLVEDHLLKEGWTLVVRGERMQHVQEEQNLPGVKPETKLPENELLSANALLKLSARVQVKDVHGVLGYKSITVGGYSRASVDLNGQIVDPATGVLKSSLNVGGSASGVKTALVVSLGGDWRIGAGGYNLSGIRDSLVGKAADEAALRMVEKLKAAYPSLPQQPTVTPWQPSSTTVTVEPSPQTILLSLPESSNAQVGDHYGIYREEKLIAEVEVRDLIGRRAVAHVVFQTDAIKATDTARKMPVVVVAE